MKVNQYGLQQCYLRAYNAIVDANLPAGVSQQSATPAQLNYALSEADKAVLSSSYLRLEQPVVTTSSIITFPILVAANNSNSNVRVTEKRLAQQDSFFCSNIAVYLAPAASATDTAFRLQTYPSAIAFPTGAAGGEFVAPLNCFYNGNISITINKQVIVPDYPMSNFLQVPQSQRTVATAASQSNQFDPSEVALWEPNINFVGTKSSTIVINTLTNPTAVDAFTYAVIIIQGVLAQNVTLMT